MLLILDGGMWPGEILLTVANEAGDVVMEMDGTPASCRDAFPRGVTPLKCTTTLETDERCMGAALYQRESLGTMTLEEGAYDSTTVGIDADCGDLDNDGFTGGSRGLRRHNLV